jgi:uncharacterized RDD family membrane protein YckC
MNPRPIMIIASRADRYIAQIIDSVVAVVPMLVVAILSAILPEALAAVFAMLFVPAALFIIGYVIFADSLPGGQSYGKRVMGIAVVDQQSGRPCSAWQSFVRNLLLGILGFFDWIFILGDQKQRLGDKAAGTIVVDVVPARVGQVRYQ